MKLKKSALVIFSGGQDSTTCLFWTKNRYEHVEAISFSYKQTHHIELLQAQLICKKLKVPQKIMNLSFNDSSSALLNPLKEIVHEKGRPPNTLVEGRNILMFTHAALYAKKQNCHDLVTGVCETDSSGYPDCRQEFVNALEKALGLGLEHPIHFHTPLMKLNKAETFQMAKDEGGLEFVLEHSHTCYKGQRTQRHPWGYGCDDCPACHLRAKGWENFQN